MKKLIAVALCALMVLVACAAMAEGADVTGTWYANAFGMSLPLELNADGTYAMDLSVMDAGVQTGNYAVDGANLVMEPGTETETVLVYDAETNTYSGDGMVISREPVAAFEPAVAVEVTDLAQVAGTWKCDMVSVFGMTVPTADAGIDLGLVVEGDQVTLTIDFLGEETLTLTGEVKDGAVVCVLPATDYSVESVYTIRLLEDGMLAVSFDIMDEEAVFYMSAAQ